ncbi:MAG: hypothetical protein EXQ58_01970 [Acidobacteria bacterium]|nr:hypothetical protein [Acidobacteriota bacterium]
MSKGFEFLGSYTLSKTLTDNLGYYGCGGINGPSAYWMNAYDRKQDRRLSFFGATHNFVWSGAYDLPPGKRRAWGNDWNPVVNAILGGWNVSNIVSLHTGFSIASGKTDSSKCRTQSKIRVVVKDPIVLLVPLPRQPVRAGPIVDWRYEY